MYSDILMPFVGMFPRFQEAELFLFAILQARRSRSKEEKEYRVPDPPNHQFLKI